ncbi:MAG: hydantoinase/oxoprolinase family protein [Bryobacteraceae bacterium]
MRIGIDVGGTFTDIVCVEDDGTVTTAKVSSTVDDYSRSITEALPGLFSRRGMTGRQVREVLHGTTVATNAILQQAGARTALITTRGFRDVLELRRIRMPELYNWNWDKPPDLVERRFRFEVNERIDARGQVLTALDPTEVAEVVDRIAALGMESVAICLLNSYVNPRHEETIARILAERHPHLLVSVSSEILREVKEYERTATVVVNAYVLPMVRHYVDSLDSSLRRIDVEAPLLIMQSNGGVMTARACSRKPVFIIESGPAAGVIAAHALSRLETLPNAITFDMGGTTAKASIIENGEMSTAAEYEVGSALSLVSRLIKGGGHLIRVPAIDVAEVGAGGGSIAWLDAGNALRIGPKSAGSTPGPVCYGLGGALATITDANLILGYINPEGLVGGGLRLDREKAEKALAEQIGRPLGMGLLEAAYGIHLMANSNMMRAVRSVSTERGRDVRNFALIAFGGSGPVHACEMGRSLEMKEAVIPPYPGLFSAFGLLSADIEHHQVQTFYHRTRAIDLEDLNLAFARLENEAAQMLHREGFAPEFIRLRRYADLRYAGQSSELTIPIPPGTLDWEIVGAIERAFDEEHERTYGHRGGEGEPYSFVNLRVIGAVERRRQVIGLKSANGFHPASRSRSAYFGSRYGLIESPVITRKDLTGTTLAGPFLVDEFDSTTVVPPGCTARLDALGNIRILIEGDRP